MRQRLSQATEERLVQGLQGYLSALAALKGWDELAQTLQKVGPLVECYLKQRDRLWPDEVRRKAARQMSVTGWLDELREAA